MFVLHRRPSSTQASRASHTIQTSPQIIASYRDCPSYLASAETVRDLLLPVESILHDKWLPVESVRVIPHPAETRSEERSRGQSRQESYFVDSRFGRKQEIADNLGGSQI